jgi:hypothetical protein
MEIKENTAMARIGKIARLPGGIRAQLNTRLHDGAEGKQIVLWLNSLPEVRKILAQHCDGRPISEQNLSQWRQGGYEETQNCPDPAHFDSKVLASLDVTELRRDIEEFAKNPPQQKTPVQAAADMLEEMDACLAKSETKAESSHPRKEPRRHSRKLAQRRPAKRATKRRVHPVRPVQPNNVAAVYDRRPGVWQNFGSLSLRQVFHVSVAGHFMRLGQPR